jgi:hypothetical protein
VSHVIIIVKRNFAMMRCVMIFFLSFEGSTVWRFCYPLLLPSVCYLSRVPWNTRTIWGFWSYGYEAGSSYSTASPDNAIRFRAVMPQPCSPLSLHCVWFEDCELGWRMWFITHYKSQVNVVILVIIAVFDFNFNYFREKKN